MARSVFVPLALSLLTQSGCQRLPIESSTLGAHSQLNSWSESSVADSKRITFIAGPLSRSVSVGQIATFVQSGDPYGDFADLLRISNLPLDQIRSELGKSYELDLIQMDKILNSQIGVALLTRIGEAIHPHKTKETAVQAIRSAIILSLAADNKLSPLEILGHLPVDLDVEIQQVLKLRDELGMVRAENAL